MLFGSNDVEATLEQFSVLTCDSYIMADPALKSLFHLKREAYLV